MYNTTDLNPETSFERHVFHRDQFAHYLRWSFILRVIRGNKDVKVCDFGCGQASLYKTFYHNMLEPLKGFVGLDIRSKTIEKNKQKYPKAEWISEDLVTLKNGTDLSAINADIVTSFEVIEHVGKKNVDAFLQNFKACGNENATYYLSTPNYDENVGAADNHTYPDEEGGEPVPQEFGFEELKQHILNNGFEIQKAVGTFASIKDYNGLLSGSLLEFYEGIKSNVDNEILSVTMAALVPPEKCRNVMWALKRK